MYRDIDVELDIRVCGDILSRDTRTAAVLFRNASNSGGVKTLLGSISLHVRGYRVGEPLASRLLIKFPPITIARLQHRFRHEFTYW